MLFVVLSTFLLPVCVLASWRAITDRVREYMIAFLLLETMMIGVFCALDFVLFYLFFEAGPDPHVLDYRGLGWRAQSLFHLQVFPLYPWRVSVFAACADLYVFCCWQHRHSGSDGAFPTEPHSENIQFWLWLGLFASFAVKVPMWPVHTWLPDAHVEAPTAGSVILAGVLLKMGGYGFLRFSIPMLPVASEFFIPFVFGLSVIAVIYTSLVALVQSDMKKLIAYSSVAHMGFVTAGIFTFTTQGVEGGIVQMLSHGVVSAALFLCVGVVYDRIHSREISTYGGLVHRMPVYAFTFMVFTLASVGLPGTSGFVGEILVLAGLFKVNSWVAALAATGVVLGAAYMLWLYRRVIFGELTKDHLKSIMDLNAREIAYFAPLIVVAIWMGVYPAPFLDVMHASVDKLLTDYQAAIDLAQASGNSSDLLQQFAGR